MNILPLIYPSAAELWLTPDSDHIAASEKRRVIALPDGYDIDIDLKNVPNAVTLPLKVLVGDKAHRVRTRSIVSSVRPAALPANSFIKIDESVYAASPELCILQSGKSLSLPQMIKLADDLCADYVSCGEDEYGQHARRPLTDADAIRRYLRKCSGVSGIKKARRAARYVLDHSGSPRESALAVMAVLPMYMGGYGLPRPILNHSVELSAEGRAHLGRQSVKCDMVWPGSRTVLEYDSNLSHLTKDQHTYDKRRYNALLMSGYRVIVFTADHLSNVNNADEAFLMLRKALGLKANRKLLEKYRSVRIKVVKELNQDYFS